MKLNIQLTILSAIFIIVLCIGNKIICGEEIPRAFFNENVITASDSTVLKVTLNKVEVIYCKSIHSKPVYYYYYRMDGSKGFLVRSRNDLLQVLEIPCKELYGCK